MNYWGEGNHQQPPPTGKEMPPWLPGALFYGAAAVAIIVALVVRWFY